MESDAGVFGALLRRLGLEAHTFAAAHAVEIYTDLQSWPQEDVHPHRSDAFQHLLGN